MSDAPYSKARITGITIACIAGIALILAAAVGLAAGCKSYSRYQKRADAANQVSVTHTLIQKEAQGVALQQQIARQKVAEAVGIRRSQDIINQTLTPLYVQHEAVQAQEAMANSPNHSEIYIPSGNNGVPLVKPVTP